MAQHEGEGVWDRIFSRENLLAALSRVRRNGGAPGVDGMTVEELPGHLKAHWPSIREKLEGGEYEPSPVRRVEIPKEGGGKRELGIPTVLDRLIQQAMHQVLSPLFEREFSEHSYGFRPGRSAHDAVRAARKHIEDGYRWLVDIDLERFFDTVNHDRLMARVRAVVKDRRVLRLVHAYLKAGVMVNGVVMERWEGTPQGGPLSPLLSNVVLTELDRKLEERGHRFVRYADDCNIYVRSKRAAKRVMANTKGFVERQMRLRVNEAKSAVELAVKRQFLGFSFYWRKGNACIRIAPERLDRAKHALRRMTRRSQGRSLEEIRERVNPFIRGWVNYFALADAKAHMQRLDEWMRRRLRQIVWKQWKTPGNRYRNLRALGVPEYWAIRVGGSSKGAWRLSASPPLQQALNNAYWQQSGLENFLHRYQLRHT